jgi:hypothetical protein
MTTTEKTKTRPVFAVASTGTALGSAGPFDSSAFQYAQIMSVHGGTGGSRTVSCWINSGTQFGTAATTFPDAILVGSRNSDKAGAGTPCWLVGSLTDQMLVTWGTSSDLSFSISYMMLE